MAPLVFKTSGRRSASPAGSIPVRLRHQVKRHVVHVARGSGLPYGRLEQRLGNAAAPGTHRPPGPGRRSCFRSRPRPGDLAQPGEIQRGVDGGRRQVGVTQDLPGLHQRRFLAQQFGGQRMTQPVRASRCDAGPPARPFHHVTNQVRADWPVRRADGQEEPAVAAPLRARREVSSGRAPLRSAGCCRAPG